MTNFYNHILSYIHHHHLEKPIITLSKVLPYIIAGLYVCTLASLMINHSPALMMTIIKPASVFLFITILRYIFDRKRPFESLNIKPLYNKNGGQSMPSRHAASALSIAFVIIPLHFYFGCFVLFLAIIVCITRVICGVHYISDVLVALVISLLFNLI